MLPAALAGVCCAGTSLNRWFCGRLQCASAGFGGLLPTYSPSCTNPASTATCLSLLPAPSVSPPAGKSSMPPRLTDLSFLLTLVATFIDLTTCCERFQRFGALSAMTGGNILPGVPTRAVNCCDGSCGNAPAVRPKTSSILPSAGKRSICS